MPQCLSLALLHTVYNVPGQRRAICLLVHGNKMMPILRSFKRHVAHMKFLCVCSKIKLPPPNKVFFSGCLKSYLSFYENSVLLMYDMCFSRMFSICVCCIDLATVAVKYIRSRLRICNVFTKPNHTERTEIK